MKKPAYHGGLLLEKAHRPHRTQGQDFSGPQERAFSAKSYKKCIDICIYICYNIIRRRGYYDNKRT